MDPKSRPAYPFDNGQGKGRLAHGVLLEFLVSLVHFIQKHYPQALPKDRAELDSVKAKEDGK